MGLIEQYRQAEEDLYAMQAFLQQVKEGTMSLVVGGVHFNFTTGGRQEGTEFEALNKHLQKCIQAVCINLTEDAITDVECDLLVLKGKAKQQAENFLKEEPE